MGLSDPGVSEDTLTLPLPCTCEHQPASVVLVLGIVWSPWLLWSQVLSHPVQELGVCSTLPVASAMQQLRLVFMFRRGRFQGPGCFCHCTHTNLRAQKPSGSMSQACLLGLAALLLAKSSRTSPNSLYPALVAWTITGTECGSKIFLYPPQICQIL